VLTLSPIGIRSGGNSSVDLRTDAFCQKDLYDEYDYSIAGLSSSSAVHGARRPAMSTLLAIVLLTTFIFVAPTSATSTGNIVRRQEPSSCQIDINSQYNPTTAGTVSISGNYFCESGAFCVFNQTVSTGFLNMNRTFNGNSAAGPEWNDFFQRLGDATTPRRGFPSTSWLQATYQWAAVAGSNTSLSFTPKQVS
jgi:hypothetical protein